MAQRSEILFLRYPLVFGSTACACLPLAGDEDKQEHKMVCSACNGKGYVVEKERELPCSECQGRGEYILGDSLSLSNLESREGVEVHRPAVLRA